MTDWIRQATLMAVVECRLQVRTAIWRVILVVSVILAGTMTNANLQEDTRRRSEFDVLVARRDLVAEHGRHAVSGFQRDEALRAIRKPEPLSVVVTGLDKRVAQYWDFGPEGITAGSPFSDESRASIDTADLDLEFILRGLMGMLALVAGFGSMVASRAGGPTKSLVSLPVRSSAVMIGAMAGGTLAVAAAAATVVGSTVATLGLINPTVISADGVVSLTMIWFASLLYSSALVGIGTAIALVVASTARAVAAMVVVWLVTTTIGGPVISAVAGGATPSQSRALFEVSRNSQYEEAVGGIETAAGNILLEARGGAELPSGFQLSGAPLEKIGEYWDRRLADLRSQLELLEAGFRRNEGTRAAQTWWLGIIFPGTALGHAVTEMAGVGEGATRRWSEDAESYQRDLSTALFDNRPRVHLRVRSGSGYRVVFHDRAPSPTVASLPEFRQRLSTPLSRLRDAASSIAAIALQAVFMWVAVGLIFLRRQLATEGWR